LLNTLSFDLDSTLFPNNIDDRLWFELIPEELAKRKKISIEKARKYAVKEYDLIGINAPRWYIPEYWLDRFQLDIDIKDLLDKMDYYKHLCSDVSSIKEHRLRIVIASNNARSMLDAKVHAIKKLGIKIDATFSVVSDLNITSKNRRFYQYICNTLDIEACDIMHIGDNIIYDLIHARASGLRSVLIDRRDRMEHDDVIHSLEELYNLIQ
jgi:putative hydrolase of the HAD superfamily